MEQGLSGAMAMVIQVLALMPLRTIMKCVFPISLKSLRPLLLRADTYPELPPKVINIASERPSSRPRNTCIHKVVILDTTQAWVLHYSKVLSVRSRLCPAIPGYTSLPVLRLS